MRFHHVGYAVADIDRYLKEFLRPLLVPSRVSPVYEDPIQRVRVLFAEVSPGTLIELVEPLDQGSPVTRFVGDARGGLVSRLADMPDDAPSHPDIQSFLTHLAKERDVSPNTLRAYRKDLATLEAFLGTQLGTGWTWDRVDRLILRGFLGYLTRKGLAKRSTARSLSAVRTTPSTRPLRTARR